jgi:short-subunit dehydrogenase
MSRTPLTPPQLAERYGPWALVAGASEGIGAAIAGQLAGAGLNLLLVARNEPLLGGVAEAIRADHDVDVRVLAHDLTDPDALDAVRHAATGVDVGLVVGNAGAANRSAFFLDDPLEDSLRLVQLNCLVPMGLAREFGPAMVDRGRGGIVLVGSMACLTGAAHVATYSAAKMFLVNFAEGLWAELGPDGVDVCATVLGSVQTPAAARQGVAFDPSTDMEPEDVATEILANIANGPTYVVGDANRAMVSAFWTFDRRAAVEMMSEATAAYAARLSPPR